MCTKIIAVSAYLHINMPNTAVYNNHQRMPENCLKQTIRYTRIDRNHRPSICDYCGGGGGALSAMKIHCN